MLFLKLDLQPLTRYLSVFEAGGFTVDDGLSFRSFRFASFRFVCFRTVRYRISWFTVEDRLVPSPLYAPGARFLPRRNRAWYPLSYACARFSQKSNYEIVNYSVILNIPYVTIIGWSSPSYPGFCRVSVMGVCDGCCRPASFSVEALVAFSLDKLG